MQFKYDKYTVTSLLISNFPTIIKWIKSSFNFKTDWVKEPVFFFIYAKL